LKWSVDVCIHNKNPIGNMITYGSCISDNFLHLDKVNE
jgi:hypothetical protein